MNGYRTTKRDLRVDQRIAIVWSDPEGQTSTVAITIDGFDRDGDPYAKGMTEAEAIDISNSTVYVLENPAPQLCGWCGDMPSLGTADFGNGYKGSCGREGHGTNFTFDSGLAQSIIRILSEERDALHAELLRHELGSRA